jgi:hypothetical protein
MPKRNMDDVMMGLSVGNFAKDEACSMTKSTVRSTSDTDTGTEMVRARAPSRQARRVASNEWGAGAGALPRLPASRSRAGVSACSHPRHGESSRVPAAQVFVAARRTIVPAQQRQVQCAHSDAATLQ